MKSFTYIDSFALQQDAQIWKLCNSHFSDGDWRLREAKLLAQGHQLVSMPPASFLTWNYLHVTAQHDGRFFLPFMRL